MKYLASFTRSQVLETVHTESNIFPFEFADWVDENFHVWEAFVAEADKVIARGFSHYSARTILHVLRHHSATSEVIDGWKLNNNTSPYLARLFAIMHPVHGTLFAFRETNVERFRR